MAAHAYAGRWPNLQPIVTYIRNLRQLVFRYLYTTQNIYDIHNI